MDCPTGKVYLPSLKRCVSKEALPGSKGRSRKACPKGKVWLPLARKCISADVFGKHYGADKLGLELARQRGLAPATAPAPAVPKAPKRITPRRSKPKVAAAAVAATPAVRKSIKMTYGLPRADSYMPPELKTKDKRLSWIKGRCKNQEDAISLMPFAELDNPDLKSIVRLGNGFCYSASDMGQHVKTSVERDIPLKDISNPWYRIDDKDLGALVKMGVNLPVKTVEFPAEHYKLYVESADNTPFKFVFLYDERRIKGGNYAPAIPAGGFLGYIPKAGTERLVGLIKRAFAAGRLFTKAVRPFGCCRFHLKKTKDYWTGDTARKIKAMEEEIEGII